MASTSSSSIQKSFKYDVFVSFRGEDTRKTFVDHLYHALDQKGITTYKHDERIEKGQTICDQLMRSIEDSRIYIIVFSKNYASSSWCLDELVHIMECHRTTGQTAYPVFFNVEATEVRHQSGAVGEAFAKLEKEEAAGIWRDAMKEATDLAGRELKTTFDGHEARFIQKIVEDISLELRFIDWSVDDKLIGMETRVKDVVSYLEYASVDVDMIGLNGIGGVGKTTLATAVFNHISDSFEGKSFVKNVREASLKHTFKYDVFLSFRGEDVRKTFVDHLYHALDQKGVITCKDDETIKKGERIGDEHIRSIEDSRFHIIVFSKNYASSSWCLDELVHIMECHKTKDQTAYPVFYDVEPSEVRKQRRAVGEAFAKHENKEAAGRWRDALKEAANLSGWDVRNTANGLEAKVIKHIVERILLELRPIYFDETLVGMETRLKNVVLSLEDGFNDVCIIGIHGIEGSGKTALARAVFNHIAISFEATSFVENVREVSKGSLSGLKELQKQILSDVLNDPSIHVTRVSDGINMMKRMMRGRKVLVVLDDVDDIEQIEALSGDRNWFKAGSIIIITTRDKQVLKAHQVNRIYDVKLLSDGEAISLFSRYAFGREIPNQGYEELSRKLVHNAAGLPSKIKHLGSYLCGRSMLEWEDALERLKSLSIQNDLQEILLKPYFNVDENLVGMDTRLKNVVSSLKNGLNDVRIIGIKGMEGSGKTALARAVFDRISNCFEGKSFVTNVTEASKVLGLEKLQSKILSDVLNDQHIVVTDVSNGRDMIKKKMRCRKVLLVLDDVDDIGQLEALAGEPNWFKAGSRIIITTRDERVLVAHQVKHIHDVTLLSHQEAMLLFCRYAFGGEIPAQEYGELSREVVDCVAGLPLTIKVLGSFLCGKIKREWEDTLERMKAMSQKEILELRYNGLEDHKEVFLDDACILKGQNKYIAMRILEIYGVDAQMGSIILRQKSSIMVSDTDRLRVHDQIEEVDGYIDHHLHPDKRNKHNRLRIKEETKDISVNNLGTEAKRSIKLEDTALCPDTRLIALNNTEELSFLYVDDGHIKWNIDEVGQYLPDTLRSLFWCHYPFRCLPNTFQANNLINLEMNGGNISQLWEGGDEKVLKNLKFLDLSNSKLKTFDLRIAPNLETLRLEKCFDFEELHVAFECPKLKYVNLTVSKLSRLDLGLIPNLEGLYLEECHDLVELHMPVKPAKLKILEVSGSKVSNRWLYPHLEKLEHLEELTLSIKEIMHLPYNICMLKHLKSLKLKSCLLLEKLPHDLDKLECLEELCVMDCISVRDIPNYICKMRCLKYLHLPHCILVKKLPEELGRLEYLEELNIEGTGISHLPQSILQSKGLCIEWSKGKLESYGFSSLKEISRYTASCCV